MTSIVLECGHTLHLTLRDCGIRRRPSVQEWKLQHDLMGGGHERVALIAFRFRRGEGLLQTPHLRFGSNKRIVHFDTAVSSLSYVRTYAIGGVDNKRLQKDQGSSLPCDETDKSNLNGASETSKSIHYVQGESELREARQCSEEGSSRAEGNLQGEADDPTTKEENESTFGTENGVRIERKGMGRPREKKKKAYCAGIATYDASSNSIRLKEETASEVGKNLSPGATQTELQPRCDSAGKDAHGESKPKKEGPRLGFKGTSKDSPLNKAVSVSAMSPKRELNLKKKPTRDFLIAKENTHLPSFQGFKEKHRNEETAAKKDDEKGTVFFKQKSYAGARDSRKISKGVPELVRPRERNDRGYVHSLKRTKTSKKEELLLEHPRGKSCVETEAEVVKALTPDSTQLLPSVTRKVGADSEASDTKRLTGPAPLPLETNQEHALHFNYLEAEQQSTLDMSTTSFASRREAPFGKTTQNIKTKLVEPVLEILPEIVIEQVSQAVDKIKVNASTATEVLISTDGQVAESMTTTANQVKKSISETAAQVSTTLTNILLEEFDSDDEFEAFKTSELGEFRGVQGLQNFEVLQEDTGILVNLQDFYFYMLKKPFPEFAAGMFAAPLALSVMFTVLYMPQFQGLALDETARSFVNSVNGVEVVHEGAIGLKLSWTTLFEVFMFSLSLSTGLQPELAPLSPYTLVVANLNALLAQLLFAFLSAAVFARLSQPSQPVKCSEVALICSNNKQRRQAGQTVNKALMIRCILTGPQPCELVDVKVDLMYNFNSVTGSGACFRGSQSLKLVRPQIAFLNHGMLVRHIIDEKSPLHCQSLESLHRDDTIFILSVTGTERSSMQAVFHVQYYSVYDGQLIWDAEFEDMILINQKNQRILDPSRLSLWRSV